MSMTEVTGSQAAAMEFVCQELAKIHGGPVYESVGWIRGFEPTVTLKSFITVTFRVWVYNMPARSILVEVLIYKSPLLDSDGPYPYILLRMEAKEDHPQGGPILFEIDKELNTREVYPIYTERFIAM